MYKYLKYKQKYLILLKYGGTNLTVNRDVANYIEKIRQSLNYNGDGQIYVREPFNAKGYSNYIVLSFFEKKDKFIYAEQLISKYIASMIEISGEDANNQKLKEKYYELLNTPIVLDYLNLLCTILAYLSIFPYTENIFLILQILSNGPLDNIINANNFISNRLKAFNDVELFVAYDKQHDKPNVLTIRKEYFCRFFYDLMTGNIIKIYQKSRGIEMNDKPISLEEQQQIILVPFPILDGDRLGNKLFYIINFILYCLDILDRYSEYKHFLISLDKHSHFKKWSNIGFSILDEPYHFANPAEITSLYPKYKCKYSPIPLFYYLMRENQKPIEGLRNYLNKITRDIRKEKYNDGKITVSVSFRGSDFCSGKTTCFDNVGEDRTKNTQGIAFDFPILSIAYYINCLDELFSDKDCSLYRIILFYQRTFIDSAILLMYAEIFRTRYKGVEVLHEHECLDYDSEGNEMDIICVAGKNQVIVCSNSTFSFHMFMYRMLYYNSSVKIYYPLGFIYMDNFFLDLSFNSLNIDKCNDFELLKWSKEDFKTQLFAKKYNFVGIESFYYVCYLPKIDVYSDTPKKILENYAKVHKSDEPHFSHVIDTIRLLLFFITICKIQNSFQIKETECKLELFDKLKPYLEYNKKDGFVHFTSHDDKINNIAFKQLISNRNFDVNFVKNLLEFLENFSFKKDTPFSYYKSMKFETDKDVGNFFTNREFDNTNVILHLV